MTEVSERYSRIARGFERRVLAISDADWSAPTPCTDWTVRDLVGHVVSVHRLVVAGLDASSPPPPATDPDLFAAWRAATVDVETALGDPGRAAAPVSGRFAPMPLEEMIGRLLCSDTLVHTFDLCLLYTSPSPRD